MRKILLGTIALVAVSAVVGMPAANAQYAGEDCNYATETTSVGGAQVGVQAGEGGMSEAAAAEVGGCVNTGMGSGVFDGGAAGVGAGESSSNRICPVQTVEPVPVGAYGVADGNNTNLSAAQLSGYAGVSTFETGGNESSPSLTNCEGADGSGTNSGGSVGVTALGLYLPVPLLACGNNDSGMNWSDSNRDGCYID